MKVGSLFAEIGFKVDESGLEKFSTALKSFQKTIREGLKDLKAYARVAKEISQAMRDAYIPNQTEARSRYRAQTSYMRSQARVNNAWAKRERSTAVSNAADSYLKSQRARFFEQDSNTRALNAQSRKRMLDYKERGLIGSHTGKFSSNIIAGLRSIVGFNFGGTIGGLASFAGFSHPIVMAITASTRILVGLLSGIIKVIRDGVRTAMSYRDYMAFTGRSTRGISGLMAASLNTTNLTPEDIMRDVAGLEKSYWDMWFGGGNPRFWQMIGQLPSGNGETDIKTILSSVYSLSGGFKNRGVARSLLGQAGLREEHITLIEDIMRNNPTMSFNELFSRTREQISSQEEGNKTLRELDRTWKELKVELAKTLLDIGIGDVLRTIAGCLQEIATWLRSFKFPWQKDEQDPERRESARKFNVAADTLVESIKDGNFTINEDTFGKLVGNMLKYSVDPYPHDSPTNTINSTVNNTVNVSSPEEAVDYTEGSRQKSIAENYWNLNSAYRMAPTK